MVEYLKVLNSRVPKGPMVEPPKGSLTVERSYLTLFDRESVNAYIIYVIMP
jgi:hypothetical protein